ncbi:DNA topoisomerase 3 [Comamonas sp.]|uniref:DNA topoisomerase 3 n=1 Tax=Comamonas sp. TaxID=34028 RepID=UPI0028A166B0|nr:DNA topoisomerase 3 [Comamonas sp.]
MRRLFIAEKPSLALAIASQLPGELVKRHGFYEVGDDVVTYSRGHALEQFMPEDYDPALKTWAFATLPMIPPAWKLAVKPDMAEQVKTIASLLKQGPQEVVNAGDPDREGQLLIDELLLFLGNRLPVRRVLVNDPNPKPVQAALARMQDNREQQFKGWYESALARSRFDWLFGLNLTRAFTIAAREKGYEGLLPVGRVQTPTLALVVARDLQIETFKPAPYFAISAVFEHANGTFKAAWKPAEEQPGLDDAGRLIDRQIAEALTAKIQGKPATVTHYEKAPKKEGAPLPFSLSALQMAANRKYGMSAQDVLNVAQTLYDAKLLTYPRSDCPYLSDEQHELAPDVLAAVQANKPELAGAIAKCNTAQKSRAYDSGKVTAHHGIVPTEARADLSRLSQEQRNIYDMVTRVYLAQFLPAREYLQTTLELQCEGETFATGGTTETAPGWRVVYTDDDADEEPSADAAQRLPAMAQGDALKCTQAQAESKQTKPPKRYTEATLMAAMVNIHKHVDDPQARARLKEGQGIGTEATRAGIIDELRNRTFLQHPKERSKELVSSTAARALIAALPPAARSAALTGICEQALDLVEQGKLSADAFIERNMALINKLIDTAKAGQINVPVTPKIACPKCGTGHLRRLKGSKGIFWACSGWSQEPKSCDAIYQDARGKPDFEAAKTYPCPACSTGKLHKRKGTNGAFWSCSNWNTEPKCSATFPDGKGKPDFEAAKTYPCPTCGTGQLRKREGKNGPFWSCSNWNTEPKCSATFPDGKGKPDFEPPKVHQCPKCNTGQLRKINGRNGVFWSCSNWNQEPKCDATFNDVGGRPSKAPQAPKKPTARRPSK